MSYYIMGQWLNNAIKAYTKMLLSLAAGVLCIIVGYDAIVFGATESTFLGLFIVVLIASVALSIKISHDASKKDC